MRSGLSLGELSRERAAFIVECGWGSAVDTLNDFETRDAVLKGAERQNEVVLWFEHDLFDQLQLIQLLDWFSTNPVPALSLICEAEYIGTMQPARAAELFALRNPVTRRHLHEAREAWATFRSPDPSSIDPAKPKALTYLGAALGRFLEEYPWTTDGLSRLERRIVELLQADPLRFPQLFLGVEEDPAFLGDAVLAWHLERMAQESLVEGEGEHWGSKRWKVTGKPRTRRLPRWLGGYEVKDETVRWDPELGRLIS